ncbi:hypothetical protein [Nannocystis pusilla]|uniref:hypothetical protein n=1 Tax=Nannocystis pusilla TaxID=889268 RepID=UPI003B7F602A
MAARGGVMTIRRSGLVRSERFKVEDGAAKLRVPIEEGHVPNLHVHVDLVGAAPRTRDDGTVDPNLAPRPATPRARSTCGSRRASARCS